MYGSLVDAEKIIYSIYKWRTLTTKQIKSVVSISSITSTYERVKALIDLGYITRKRYVYGLPGVCTLTRKASRDFEVGSINSVNIVTLKHNLLVVDLAIELQKNKVLDFDDITTEKELMTMEYKKSKRRLLRKKHYPDFVYKSSDNELMAVEVELSKKPIRALESNVSDNFLKYSKQFWFVRKYKKGILNNMERVKKKYPLQIRFLEDMGL